jgi:hypothetical protein
MSAALITVHSEDRAAIVVSAFLHLEQSKSTPIECYNSFPLCPICNTTILQLSESVTILF